MLEKMKKIISITYIIFFAPFCVNFLFPLMQLYFLGKDRNYYLTSVVSISNYILIALSAMILLVTFIQNIGQIHEIFYYLLGMITAILCKNLYCSFYNAYFLNENLLCGFFALGYLFVILCIIIGAMSKAKSGMVKV